MVKPLSAFESNRKPDNFAQPKIKAAQNCSNLTDGPSDYEGTSLLLDILKTLEIRLQQRGFLTQFSAGEVQPLWFIAENARNTYLWRSGYSLEDVNRFEFWVDIRKLATKRINQLELLRDGFSLSSLPWGLELPDQNNLLMEIDYIRNFLLVTRKIRRHIVALSQAGLLLAGEFQPPLQPRQVVVLPC